MSFVVDANILIYGINQDSEFNAGAKKFIEQCAVIDEPWFMPWPVISAFIRISTHPAILPHPLSTPQAVAAMDQILELPNVVMPGEDGGNLWKRFSKEISTLHCKGNVVTDALIVCIMREHGITKLYSKDRDFLKFRGIKVIDPIDV